MAFITEHSTTPPAPSTTLTQQYESGGPYSADHAEASVSITRSALAATGPALLGRIQGNKGPIDQIPLGAGLAFVAGALAATGGGGGGGGAVASVNTRTGAVVITVADVGLSLVNNTADVSKPVSTAQAAADTAVAATASAALSSHAGNAANPHAVTAAQVGAPSGSGTSTGANSGDNAVNTQYSGLVSNATHTGDAAGATVLTLATVNATPGVYANATVTVNAKGLVTAAAAGSGAGGNASQLLTATWAAPAAIGSTTPNTGAFTTLSATGAATVNSVAVSGNISAPAWTTSGLRIKGIPGTLTDTTSLGTVPMAYTDSFGGNTIAASNATTFTNYFTAYFKEGVPGANVTIPGRWALGAESMRVGTSGFFAVSTAGVASAPNLSGTNTGDNATNSQYSGLAASKQDTLVSATNIKTINSTSLLGAGNIVIGGGVVGTDTQLTFNDAGAGAGAANLLYNKTTNQLSLNASRLRMNAALTYDGYITDGGGGVVVGRSDSGEVVFMGESTTATITIKSTGYIGFANLSSVAGGNSTAYAAFKKLARNSIGVVDPSNADAPGSLSAANFIASALIYYGQFTTATAPTYVKGASYFDITLNKLRIGGATAWESVTST